MIFNLSGGAFETPTLNPNYPADVSTNVISGQSKNVTFKVEIATHGAPTEYTYQWYENGAAISGATSASYTKTVSAGGTHTFYCKVTNAAGTVTSRTATMNVTLYKTPVLDSSYPANVTQIEKSGGSASFKVSIKTAGVPASYTYQWYVDGSAVSGATSSSYTKSGLTTTGTYKIHCVVKNAAGAVTSRTATLTVQSSQPVYTYSGSHELIKDGTYNWRIKLKTSGILTFSHFGTYNGADLFAVGAGGGGGGGVTGAGGHRGAGGGYTTTKKAVTLKAGTQYTVTIGAGAIGADGGYTSIVNGSAEVITANGGKSAGHVADGGSGGGGYGGTSSSDKGGQGGSDGSDGKNGTSSSYLGGKGQGTTTREFGESSGTLYAGGGGGASYAGTAGAGGSGGGGAGGVGSAAGKNGSTNTGGGGGGCCYFSSQGMKANSTGGSGIVVIRNAR